MSQRMTDSGAGGPSPAQGDRPAAQGDGRCVTRSLAQVPAFRLLYTDYRPDGDLAEHSRQLLPQPVLALTFGLEGESAFHGQCGSRIHFKPDHVTLTAFSASDGERLYQGGRHVRQLRLLAGMDTLAQYLDATQCRQLLDPDSHIRMLSSSPLTQDERVALRALLCLSDAAGPDRLQAHLLSLGLMAGQLRRLLECDVVAAGALRAAERDRIEQARRMLDDSLGGVVSMADVARAVGMGEARLRQGFVQCFQVNPAQYLLAARMRRALALLQSGCQVAQAAYAVGYGHPGNFSAAFSRFYGYPPKQVFRHGGGSARR